MAGLVQIPAKDLHVSHMVRTSRSAAIEAISSFQRSYLHSPDQESIRRDFDMVRPLNLLSLEMRAEVGSTSVKEDHLCFRC